MRTVLLLLLLPLTLVASDFTPDPLAVRRHGPAYRYPQAGWIVLHIEGKPFERGYQHGTLMATEIAAYIRCFAAQQGAKDPAGAWQHTRRLASALFLRKFDREYLQEMRGIAEGASDAAATVFGRAIDLTDIVAVNCWAEIETLDGGLDALPTGLEGTKFPGKKPKAMPAAKAEHCSAFAATGPATADGKIVFGHITMFGLYPARFYNVWLDVKPDKGHRVLMQSYPGGIQSGMDYYLNDAGLMVCETTIAQTRYQPEAIPLTNRIRKALQYGESIDDVVKILADGNNGLYTNEWLLGDTKTNEIAMFELGTKATKLWRSSKNEWFGGTEGFYWGCNNTKDLAVRLDTMADLRERPQSTVWSPSPRDKKWLQFYEHYKGKITGDAGRVVFTTPPICAASSLDAKVTTTDLAKQLKTLAVFGPPIGGTWDPIDAEKGEYPEIVPLVQNDWTTLHPGSPSQGETVKAIDLPAKAGPYLTYSSRLPEGLPTTKAAWHGTLLAKSDADIWFTEGFVALERIVAIEHSLRDGHDDGELTAEDKERLEVERFAHATAAWRFNAGLKTGGHSNGNTDRDRWLRGRIGLGVLLLNALRTEVGGKAFDDGMDEFGRLHAGKTMSADEFEAFAKKKWSKDATEIWAKWTATNKSGQQFTLRSWAHEQELTSIVYGTAGDVDANRETANRLQYMIVKNGSNIRLPIHTDNEALRSSDTIEGRHVLLIGGPTTNKLAAKWRAQFPVTFAAGSFRVREEHFAHPGSAVVAVGPCPGDDARSAVIIAGLSAEATQFAPPILLNRELRPGNVLLIPNQGKARSLVVK